MKYLTIFFILFLILALNVSTTLAQNDDSGSYQDYSNSYTADGGYTGTNSYSTDFSTDTGFSDVSFSGENNSGYSIDGNQISFDPGVAPNDVGYTYSTGFHASVGADGGLNVEGPPGMDGQVSQNADGSYTVSFEAPSSNDATSTDNSLTIGNDTVSDNNGNSNNGNSDTVTIDAPDPNPTYPQLEGGPPEVTATTRCVEDKPVIDLSWTPSPLSAGINHDWVVLKNGTTGPYRQVSAPTTTFTDSLIPPNYSVLPNTLYLYRVYGWRGGGYRTLLSDVILVFSRDCSPPAPTITLSCPNLNPETNHVANIAWDYTRSNTTGYRLYRGTNGDQATRTFMSPKRPASPRTYTDSTILPNTSYNYWYTELKTIITPAWTETTSTDENGNPTGTIEHPILYTDVESRFSLMSSDVTPLACTSAIQAPATPPTVTFSVTTPTGTTTAPALPVSLNQNTTPVTLNWSSTNADTCTASSAWNGLVGTSGSQAITTTTFGSLIYTLTCTNTYGSTPASIQLNVTQFPKPFIQTTGGDVHTNETITITP